MKIMYLDFLYTISGDLQHDRKEILTSAFQSKISGEYPAIDDLYKLETYEIMRMPVIQLAKVNPQKPIQPVMRLKTLCCSCFQGCIFLYLFSGEDRQFYDANF